MIWLIKIASHRLAFKEPFAFDHEWNKLKIKFIGIVHFLELAVGNMICG